MLKLLKKMRTREIIMCVLCAALILAQIYFDLRLPDYMSELTQLIQAGGNEINPIIATGVEMLCCVLISAVLCVLCGYLSSRAASGFTFGIREDLFSHIINLGQEEIQKFSVPSLITRSTNDITQLQMVIAMGLQNIIKAPVMAVWAIIKILGKSRELSLVTAIFIAVICVSVITIFSFVMPRFRIVQKLTDKINRTVRENLIGLNVVRAFNAEEYQNEKFEETNSSMFKIQLFNQRMFAAMQPVMQLGMNGLSLTIYWLGAALLGNIAISDISSRLTMFGNIVVFSTYATYVVMSFIMLVMIFMMLPSAQVSAERINEVLDTTATIREGNVTNTPQSGTVEFKNVSFRYPDSGEYCLENISFKVNKGETLAIIGATGSGKTTLVSLIPRFYDATCGEVLINGVNVKDYTFDSLYNLLGYVTQKAVLFSGTISENIAFGESNTQITATDIYNSISVAQAKEFVDKLDGGADYFIAQSGKNVSGGQKQRLSIARALARNAQILIFDDSFSALDYRTDAALRKSLSEKLGDTTKIIVAQRISTIRGADRILVLDDGKIVGDGVHSELMENCAIYREIAQSQLSESELA